MIKAVTFKPEHIQALEGRLKPIYDGDFEQLPRLAASWDDSGNYLHTIMAGDEVLAVVGGTQPWEGVLEVFTFLSTDIEKHGIAFARKIRAILDFYFRELKLHRMQAYARAGYRDATRFLRFLGFELEAHHKMMGPEKADYFMFARFK